MPACSAIRLKIASAMGERQVLPVQTNKMRVNDRFLLMRVVSYASVVWTCAGMD
jgi:hypothetical protein